MTFSKQVKPKEAFLSPDPLISRERKSLNISSRTAISSMNSRRRRRISCLSEKKREAKKPKRKSSDSRSMNDEKIS